MRKDNAAISAGKGEANDVLKFLEMWEYVSRVNMPGGSKEWNKHVPNLLLSTRIGKISITFYDTSTGTYPPPPPPPPPPPNTTFHYDVLKVIAV